MDLMNLIRPVSYLLSTSEMEHKISTQNSETPIYLYLSCKFISQYKFFIWITWIWNRK